MPTPLDSNQYRSKGGLRSGPAGLKQAFWLAHRPRDRASCHDLFVMARYPEHPIHAREFPSAGKPYMQALFRLSTRGPRE